MKIEKVNKVISKMEAGINDYNIFHDIAGHPEYQITKAGVIRKKKKNYYPTIGNNQGYPEISINGKKYYVAELVMKTFVGEKPNESYCISRIDNNPKNSRLDNLKYTTKQENINNHGIKTSTEKPVIQFSLNEEKLREFDTVQAAADFCGIDRANIFRACDPSSKRKTAAGYIWKYKNEKDVPTYENNISTGKLIKDFTDYIVFPNGKVGHLVDDRTRAKLLNSCSCKGNTDKKDESKYQSVTLTRTDIVYVKQVIDELFTKEEQKKMDMSKFKEKTGYQNYNFYPDGKIIFKKGTIKEKILPKMKDDKNNEYVLLNFRKYVKVHKLVAEHFIINDDPVHKTEINHKDRNKANNKVDNLEWVSRSENIKHAKRK